MTEHELKVLKQRLTAVETNVLKLVQAVTGISAAVQMAQSLPSKCASCDRDLDDDDLGACERWSCPCGLN